MLSRTLRHTARVLLRTIVPEACLLCGCDMSPNPTAGLMCAPCRQNLPIAEQICQRCAAPVGPYLDTTAGCGHCGKDRFPFCGAVALGEYRDGLRLAVLQCKRAGGVPLLNWLADALWERHGAQLAAVGIEEVTAVPQHWRRRLTVPQNPAALLAARLATRLQVPLATSKLQKIRSTPAQASLPPAARRTNLRHAFLARGTPCKTVLLVDDVLTTGTTASRAGRALLAAGAETVWVAVVARGIGV